MITDEETRETELRKAIAGFGAKGEKFRQASEKLDMPYATLKAAATQGKLALSPDKKRIYGDDRLLKYLLSYTPRNKKISYDNKQGPTPSALTKSTGTVSLVSANTEPLGDKDLIVAITDEVSRHNAAMTSLIARLGSQDSADAELIKRARELFNV